MAVDDKIFLNSDELRIFCEGKNLNDAVKNSRNLEETTLPND